MVKKENKKSQVTIFIIIAIIIVAALLIIFYPRININIFAQKSPQGYIEDCLKDDVDANLLKLENQGGSLNPENYVLYKDNRIEYLCYTNEYYTTCKMQQPFVKEHAENELKASLQDKSEKCINALAADYESKGYVVSKNTPAVSVEFVPHNIRIELTSNLVFKKGETTESYEKIVIAKKSDIYDFTMICESILNWEARYGDSAPESYMYYYPDLKVEKLKLGDGSKIYTLSNRGTNEKFLFASRSLSWPAGYNVNNEVVR